MAVMAARADADADADADKQTSVQFHQFVDLPAELRIKIIQEFIATLRKQRRSRPPLAGPFPFPKFAPFAVIHSEWQHEFEAEQELFGSLCLSTDDLPTFHKMLNKHRSRFLSEVGLRVCIDNKVINFSEQSDAVVYRAGKFIVNSVATILESVENATRVGFQTTEAKLELYTQIITPQGFHRASSLPSRIKCDFSRLPLIHATRKLSQRRFKYGQWNSLRYPRMLLISPSSMLTLASRMPNLEEADVGISSGASTGAIRALQPNACPRLKTLRIPDFPFGPSSYDLSRWASSWGDKIENLEILQTEIPSFLRNFVKLDETRGANAWLNLQVLKIDGACKAGPIFSLADLLTPSDGPIDALSAMAVALPWLPSIRDMTINLKVITRSCLTTIGHVEIFFVAIKLHLGSGSGNLTISQPSEYQGRSGLSRMLWSDSLGSNELSFRGHMQDAAAEVHAAVQINRGHDLEIVWPETDEEPQSG